MQLKHKMLLFAQSFKTTSLFILTLQPISYFTALKAHAGSCVFKCCSVTQTSQLNMDKQVAFSF